MFNLATCRKILWNYASNVPFATRTSEDVFQWNSKLVQTLERFFSLGTWRAMWKRPVLQIYGNTLTLPRGFETCHGCNPAAGASFPIYSRFNEFASAGAYCFGPTTGSEPDGFFSYGLSLISETAQTFIKPTGIFTLRIVGTETTDLSPGVFLSGGFDENGRELFGTIQLDITNGATETTQQYTELPLFEKVFSQNAVSLYAVDVTTSEATLIAVYSPGETLPAYRQYAVSGVCDGDLVRALCKLKLVIPFTDTDQVIPPNMGAIKLGLMSIQYEDKNDHERSAVAMGPNYPTENPGKPYGAIDLLESEVEELTEAEIPSFHVSASFGAGSVPTIY
jgi:hypothetical protein